MIFFTILLMNYLLILNINRYMIVRKGVRIPNILNDAFKDTKLTLYNTKDPNELLKYYHDRLSPNTKNKNDRGEVFTPIKLVEEMLDKLPEDVWSNPNLKWLDPATGIGNFPYCVYMRLMKGLRGKIPNEEKRRKWILEEMLYMVEIDKMNVFVLKQIFCGRKYKLNVFEGSFIKETNNKNVDILFGNKVINKEDNLKFEKNIKDIKFDIIMGNPPYNEGGIKSKKSKKNINLREKNENEKKTIWNFFIHFSFNKLKENGYLTFITPLSWLKSTHNCHNLLLDKHIIYLQLWDNSKSKQSINGEIPISIYLIHNLKNNKKIKTNIKIENLRQKYKSNYEIYLDKSNSIPLGFIPQLLKLKDFIIKNKCHLEYKNIKSTKSELLFHKKTKLPDLNKIKLKDNYCIDSYTIKEGYLGNKTNKQHPDADKRKLIISNKATLDGLFIDEGKLGICGNDNYYILGNNLELIKKIFDFKIIKIASLFTKFRQNFMDTDLFKFYVPDLRKLGYKNITEDKLYKLIGLIKNEIIEIKNFL